MRVLTAYVVMCAIWGTTWLGIKVGLHYLPPLTGVGLRFVVAGTVMFAAAAVGGQLRPLTQIPWKFVLVLATCMCSLNYILTYTAETHLDSGLVAVLFGTMPFFVFGFSHLLTKERTTPRIWIGAAVGFAGVAVISLVSQARGEVLFAIAAIGASAVSAFGNVYARRHAQHTPLLTLPPAMLLAGLAVGAAGLLTERVDWRLATAPQSIGVLLYLAILGSSLTFFLNLWLVQRMPAWKVGLRALVIPVIAVAVGALLGGESFTARDLFGAALVVAGMWIAMSQHEAAAETVETETP
jgi:drug/metabolite transporter (DMT)-like permease